jgi:SAM-dependent methyltransferase
MSSETSARIKALWEDRALNTELTEETVTHPDRNQRLLENDVILQHLPLGQCILDVGCGNGFSTAVFSHYAARIVGIDYSAAMIERAKRKFHDLPNVEFIKQDVLELNLQMQSFDVAISQRCLINLPTWETQQKALINIANVLKPGGFFFFQEGTRQGREKLNQIRETFGLDRMPPVAFNLDFDEELLWPYLRQYFDIVEIRRFGIYDLISRIVHPLIVSPEKPQYDAKINEVAWHLSAKLTGAEEMSREFSAVLRRLRK